MCCVKIVKLSMCDTREIWIFTDGGEPSFSAWLQFQNISLVFLPRHEYTYVKTGKEMDSGTAVRIFALDTPILSAHPEFGDGLTSG